MKNIGQQIRLLRVQKNIGLNEFAKELGVSPGYLSNLETGKTQTIQFDVLDAINEKLKLLPEFESNSNETGFEYRMKRSYGMLSQLHKEKPDSAEFLLSHLEKGLELFFNDSHRTNTPLGIMPGILKKHTQK